MTVLLVVGVGVVVLGGLILLLFPDRPGGKVGWQGVEVSSIGAGLPLIVVGIAAIAIGGGGAIRGDSVGGIFGGDGGDGDSADQTTPAGRTTAVLECPDLPQTRVVKDVPQGVTALVILGPAESKTEPFTLRFRDNNQTVGALTARLLPSEVFEIQSFVDVDCQSRQIESNEPGGAALDAIPNFGNVTIPDLMGLSYTLNLGYTGTDILVYFVEVRPL